MSKRKQFLTYEDAVPAKQQHTSPCSDCPFSRKALAGWLAGETPENWIQMAHGETLFECHTRLNQQCAGSAIYRSNILKSPRDKSILVLPSNKQKCFSSPQEFLQHHNRE